MGVKGLGLSCELMTRYHLKYTSIIGILAYMHVAIVTSDQYIMTERKLRLCEHPQLSTENYKPTCLQEPSAYTQKVFTLHTTFAIFASWK